MIFKRTHRSIFSILLLVFCFLISASTATTSASAADKVYGVMDSDTYQKTLGKGFLGKRYGAVVDGIHCDCSGYTKAALNRMKSSNAGSQSFKNYHVNARCTSAWVHGSKVSFTSAKVKSGGITWNRNSYKRRIGKSSKNHSKLNTLQLGDVMVYGKGRGKSSSHIAVYFGKFRSAKEVKDKLVSLGIYKKNDLKKTRSGKYTYKGKTIIRSYTKSSYWRIHSTYGGIMIDNDIAGKSAYTSSFGKWKWTFASGIRTK